MFRKPRIIAEMGVGWDGNFELAKRYIEVAAAAGADFIKLQSRGNVRECTPREEWDKPRVPPWGGPAIPYIEYREKMEFTPEQYKEIDQHCKSRGIKWATSVWGLSSLDQIKEFDLPWLKIPSAKMMEKDLIKATSEWALKKHRKMIISTGMSTKEELFQLDKFLSDINFPREKLIIFNCNSSYPSKTSELNLSLIEFLYDLFDCEIGYSSHSTTLGTTVAATYLGYKWLEVHITHNRALNYGDHSSAVTFHGLFKLVSGVNDLVEAYGDGEKRLYDGEIGPRKKLRGS